MCEWNGMIFSNMFKQVVQRYSNKEAIVIDGLKVTYYELDLLTDSLGLGFLQIGIQKDDNVAIWLPNSLEWIICFFALAKIGAVSVPVNTRFKIAELEYILNQSESIMLIMRNKVYETDYLHILSSICSENTFLHDVEFKCDKVKKLKYVVGAGGGLPLPFLELNEIIESGKEMNKQLLSERQSLMEPNDTILIQYTSGTTAFPKGVMLSHNNIIRNAVNFSRRMKLGEADKIFGPLPLFHVGGSVTSLMAAIVIGATYYSMEYFDAEKSLQLIENEKCTMQIALSTFFIKQMESENFESYDLSSLKTGFCGGGAELQKLVISKMGIDGLCNLYGLSECSPNVTLTSPDLDVETRIHKMGKPQPGVEIKIIDIESSSTLPPDKEGEICVRGWNVMKGYYNKPEETKKVIVANGWLHTGDLGTIDKEGFLTFTGRLKNVLKVGGENVSTEEIENFLMGHPKIKYVEIVGVPDIKLDEVITAFIELKEDEECTEEEIIQFCRGKIARFKIPRYVQFVKDFPMTASGKVKKYELREIAKKILVCREVNKKAD